jgi:predicted nucleic acid-binding protein
VTGSPELLVDTSVAVPLVVADHENHRAVARSIGRLQLGLAGHAAFETFSVLTRLPPPARRMPLAVQRLLTQNFPATLFLPPGAADRLLDELATLGIAGGAIYDALVGATAREHAVELATRDLRAADTYRALGVTIRIID